MHQGSHHGFLGSLLDQPCQLHSLLFLHDQLQPILFLSKGLHLPRWRYGESAVFAITVIRRSLRGIVVLNSSSYVS